MIKLEQMKNGLYLLTIEKNGCIMQHVFADPAEKINIADLEPAEKQVFKLTIN